MSDQSINAQLIAALVCAEVPRKNINPDVALGDDALYYTFNYDAMPDDYSDNHPDVERLLIQVHLYCPHRYNPLTLRNATKQRLYRAGFGWPSEYDATNSYAASGKESQHFVFECEGLRGIDYGEV